MLINKWKMSVLALLAGTATTVLGYREPGDDADEPAGPPIPHLIDDVSRLSPEAARMHAYVSTPFFPHELAYRQIPWLVDLNEGIRIARDEKRPLLLWTSGDEPLDRC